MARRTIATPTAASKPVIPEDTCPYIDMVIEVIDKMAAQSDDSWRYKQADLAKALLEHVRDSNHALRTASKHWHDRAKRTS